MTDFQIFVGIDVSKDHLDFASRDASNAKTVYHGRCGSGFEDISGLLGQILAANPDRRPLFCMEATGYYSEHVAKFLYQEGFPVWVENALRIKRSLGLARGKNDQVDSARIADYASRHADKFTPFAPPSEAISKLRHLQRLRENLVDSKKRLDTHLKEAKRYLPADEFALLERHSEATRAGLADNIAAIERSVAQTISEEPEVKRNFALACSVPGVGPVTATELIVATHNFTLFGTARQLACYCGVAPFEHSSGKQQGRRRVSKLANMRLKTLLHLCAVSIVGRKKACVLRDFYEKKVAEGKAKRVVINAVRNKIIHRIFACVRKGVPYDPDYARREESPFVESAMAKKT